MPRLDVAVGIARERRDFVSGAVDVIQFEDACRREGGSAVMSGMCTEALTFAGTHHAHPFLAGEVGAAVVAQEILGVFGVFFLLARSGMSRGKGRLCGSLPASRSIPRTCRVVSLRDSEVVRVMIYLGVELEGCFRVFDPEHRVVELCAGGQSVIGWR